MVSSGPEAEVGRSQIQGLTGKMKLCIEKMRPEVIACYVGDSGFNPLYQKNWAWGGRETLLNQ